jgi:transposase
MGRNRTPTQVLEARGAFIHNPDRREDRANEPVPVGEIRKSAPGYLSPEEKKIWREIIKKTPPGVLADCDEFWLAELTILEHRRRLRTITVSERTAWMTMLSRMGMNPADRSKVAARPVAKKEDEWSELDSTQTM